MNQRCINPDAPNFVCYGGRKIGIHPEWIDNDVGCAEPYKTGDRSGLVRFIEWIENNLGPRPEGHSLDRIDNNKNYEPGNLRWADATTQQNNRRPPKSKREAKQQLIFGY